MVTPQIKVLDRRRKREYSKNQKSAKWSILNEEFNEKGKVVKASYRSKIVDDLKTSNSSQWYSKVKRMSGKRLQNEFQVEELENKPEEEQAEIIADF